LTATALVTPVTSLSLTGPSHPNNHARPGQRSRSGSACDRRQPSPLAQSPGHTRTAPLHARARQSPRINHQGLPSYEVLVIRDPNMKPEGPTTCSCRSPNAQCRRLLHGIRSMPNHRRSTHTSLRNRPPNAETEPSGTNRPPTHRQRSKDQRNPPNQRPQGSQPKPVTTH
jgi:hypothetical protein